MPTEKNFNATTPAAPAGFVNAIWQVATSPSGNDPTTGQPVYPASCYVPIAENKGTISLTVDGGGAVPSTGIKGFIQLPYACTITGWSVIADQSGSASVDVWYIAGSGAPPAAPNIPTSANKISASAPAALSSAQTAAGGATAIGTWTTSLAQWGTVGFNLSSIATCTRITLEILVTKL
jgi:hypothetical protein